MDLEARDTRAERLADLDAADARGGRPADVADRDRRANSYCACLDADCVRRDGAIRVGLDVDAAARLRDLRPGVDVRALLAVVVDDGDLSSDPDETTGAGYRIRRGVLGQVRLDEDRAARARDRRVLLDPGVGRGLDVADHQPDTDADEAAADRAADSEQACVVERPDRDVPARGDGAVDGRARAGRDRGGQGIVGRA